MDEFLSFFGGLLTCLPWRNPLHPSSGHDRRADLRLRVALESELQGRP
jgi:hypothetical protein